MNRTTRTTRSAIGVVALALAIVALAACGGSAATDTTPPDAVAATADRRPPRRSRPRLPRPAGSAPSWTPRSRASRSAARPSTAGEAKAGDLFDGDGCVYRARGSTSWISVWVYRGVARDDWDATQEKTGAAQGEPLEGLGDIAYRYVGRSTGLTLSAFANGLGVTVKVAMPGITADASTAPEEIVRSLLTALG